MNESIQKALKALSQANIADYFDEMDKITPAHKLAELNNLRSMFTSNRYEHDFHQKLEVFAHHITDAPSQELTKDKEDTIIINNQGATIGQQNINSTVNNQGTNFNF